ncbi:hypothetical protein J2T09_001685 [Neorhizobium huautlense]|uniref:Uncharacterized protein n=1 Tax=Neorhizobium huautlense TaxID=67774 RepID=A0ABT9PR45_9HYPH|nr:hypothetical protein [Neorhizobium huautlense]MDP9836940.1 hypothetical protein [Neorhizobium huautlense]
MSGLVRHVLHLPHADIPLYFRHFRLDIAYREGMAPDEERREVLEEAFAELQQGLRYGFFCWDGFSTRETAEVEVRWSDAGDMSVTVSSESIHYNALVAAIRITARLHHTSQEGYEAMRAILGDDADGLPAPVSFTQNVSSLAISDIVAAGQDIVATADVLNFIADGIRFPDFAPFAKGIGEDYTGGRLIATVSDGGSFPAGDPIDIEDYFLRLFAGGVFTSVDDLDREVADNEAEIFTRRRDGRTELLIDDYTDQKYGLIELFNVVAGGHMTRLDIRSEGDD